MTLSLVFRRRFQVDLAAGFDWYEEQRSGLGEYFLSAVLLAYSKGIVRSRDIEALCRDNIVFNAISGDSQPHFTTIAKFVSSQRPAIIELFAQVLVICNRQGLIGGQMFAIDGAKLPSNASKRKSGLRADFEREAAKMEAAVSKMIERHQACDTQGEASALAQEQARARRMQRLTREAKEIRQWLSEHPEDRKGSSGGSRQSNRTDNESAKMATAKGVIQGYTAASRYAAGTKSTASGNSTAWCTTSRSANHGYAR